MDVDRKAVADPLALHCGWTGLSRTNLPPAETEREPGWYWVRVGDGPPEIAQWDALERCWRSTFWYAPDGVAEAWPGHVAVLSPRLVPPGAPGPEPRPAVRVRWGVPVGEDTPDGGRS